MLEIHVEVRSQDLDKDALEKWIASVVRIAIHTLRFNGSGYQDVETNIRFGTTEPEDSDVVMVTIAVEGATYRTVGQMTEAGKMISDEINNRRFDLPRLASRPLIVRLLVYHRPTIHTFELSS
jgi:hypothetical protein